MHTTHIRRTGRRRARSMLVATAGLLATSVVAAAPSVHAVPTAPGTVIDDFEDGDVSDWGFFGGNAAGGGGGALSDRPAEGTGYLSTGWGGDGTASAFYGGTFKNFDNAAQVIPPVDPWFNMWVLNQSDATVDAYTLEITLREDTNGDGWTNGAEDSVGLNTSFSSAQFDDRWTLISAPLSSFFDKGTGGNGVFDGTLDEIVLVVAGVQGAVGSTVELDVDTISFTSGAPAGFDEVLFDDMEHGAPFVNGWFSFTGDVGGGGIAPNTADVPASGGAFSLESGWGSGGNAGYYGGFGRTYPVDISGTEYFNFWINPDAGQEYTLQINLQEDDNGLDGATNVGGFDDEFQYDCVVGATGACATAGGGWQLVSIPLAEFFDDNSYFTGGNGVLDPTPVARGGNGELFSVVIAVIGTGSDVNFRTDDWVFSATPVVPPAPGTVIDDFESGIAPGGACPAGGLPLGFCTFADPNSTVSIATAIAPTPVPGAGVAGQALQLDADVVSYAGFIHGFANATGDGWAPQDWSTSEGLSFWMYGAGSGTTMFVDVLDNLAPGSTGDTAERFSVDFVDDVAGWRLLELPFSSFRRKEVGNGAPNDGFGLFEIHGYAIGAVTTAAPLTVFVDDVSRYGVAEPPAVAVNLAQQNTFVTEGGTAQVAVKLNRPLGADDPDQVSIDYATERSYAVPGEEFTPTSGTLTFVKGGATEQSFEVQTFDDTKFEGDEQIVVRLTNPVGVERGSLFQGSVLIDDDDPYDPKLLDDFEQGVFLWDAEGDASIDAVRVESTDAGARPGQDPVEHVGTAQLPVSLEVQFGGRACPKGKSAIVPVSVLSSAVFDATTIDHTTVRLGDASELHVDRRTGEPRRHVEDVNGDGLDDLVLHFRFRDTGLSCDDDHGSERTSSDRRGRDERRDDRDDRRKGDRDERDDRDDDRKKGDRDEPDDRDDDRKNDDRDDQDDRVSWPLTGSTFDGRPVSNVGGFDAELGRDFALGQDWSGTESLDFWYHGAGGGDEVTVTLKDNRAPDPGPAGWTEVWSDEFDGPAGTTPDPANWSYEIGDTTPDGKNGWGNEELQYYTDDPDNAATDGEGNLVITLDEADPGQECYYGPCEYESARLITQYKAEFAYGRIESRLKVPTGGDGLWPAFWSLGTDITHNPWPGAGEIDIMEYVSRIPNEIFGTVHGPGYSGGQSIGDIYDFGTGRVDEAFHTYAVEWQPDLIVWYIDDIEYHRVTPADLPGEWVFDKPFFLLLNFAIGGNFGGNVDPANTYPQQYLVDYVKVLQGPDTAERFEASFTDDTPGWKQVSIPMTAFERSDDQPDLAPDDGLTLTDVWGYGFEFPDGTASGDAGFDLVRRTPFPPPTEITVTSLDDSGNGSLRDALARIADGGTITFDPSLAGGTVALTSGELVADRSVTIDASAVPGLVLSGNGTSRVLRVTAGSTVHASDLVIQDGVAAPQGGGIFNAGELHLDRVVVTNNLEDSGGAPSFDLGGGGIYNGDGAILTLTDSEVSDNATVGQPGGGVYGFFNSSITVTRSTISGNVAGDVAGGLRTLGDLTVVDSTISGNTSTAWHGGALFATDGTVSISHSTIVGNQAPAGTAGGLMVATFGAAVDVTLVANLIADNGSYNCQVEGNPAVAVLTSIGSNVVTDGSCAQVTGDIVVAPGDAGYGPLVDNGGPTLTHALLSGSPAIDTAIAGTCPGTDQRGVSRPQGAACDVGSFELVQP